MRYYLDTEFDGFGGSLLSIALVSECGEREFYGIIYDRRQKIRDQWVAKNVIPNLLACEDEPIRFCSTIRPEVLARSLCYFLSEDPHPVIVVDWPDDAAYFARALMTGPGIMVDMSRFTIEFIRCRDWSTADASIVPHNALYDARALRDHLKAN